MIGLCNANNREEAKQELKVALREFNAIEYKIMEEIQLYTNDLTQQGWEVLFDLLYDYTQVADDSMMFLRLNAKDVLFISFLLQWRMYQNNFLIIFYCVCRKNIIE